MKTGWEVINRAIFQEKENDGSGKECGVQLKRPGFKGKSVNQVQRIQGSAHCLTQLLMTWWVTYARHIHCKVDK